MEKKRSINVLFLGSIQRNQDYQGVEKPTDEIDFGRPVKITLVRIPKPKRQLYGRLTSITQPQPIKGFQIYFRNLQDTNGRYSLLTCSNDFMITSTQDVLITPLKPFITDLLVIRGAFSKLSLCIYGNLVEQVGANLWKKDASVGEVGMAVEIKRNIFEEKRKCIIAIESQLEELQLLGRGCINLSTADSWQQAANDDDINEPQIKNICNISQHLLNTFQQINDDQYIASFRQKIQTINNHLQKLFKSKQIGLYYPKQQNYTIQNEIPLPLIHIALSSLKLVLSDQFRVLEMLKMLVQLPRHANALIEAGGVAQLSSLFIQFYKPNAVFFSTFKNLVLQVCIALAQWPTAAQRMVTKLEEDFFQDIYQPLISKQKQEQNKAKEKQKQKQRQRQKERQKQRKQQKQKQKNRSLSRSRQKGKQKRSRSDDSDNSDEDDKRKKQKNKKQRKDKKKKQKEKEKDKTKQKKKDKQHNRDRDKYGDDKRDKQKQKKKDKQKQKESKQKQQKQKITKKEDYSPAKADSSQSQPQHNKLSFYQLLFFILLQQKNSKTLNLIKILIQQIAQTLTKNKDLSEQIAHFTTFLRDTKYLFNQGTQIINSKSLKVFAAFQPFLNDNQSQNVDCKYISEKQKLKNPLKYGINPKTFKILNKINYDIVSNAHKQGLGVGTPFDEYFMVMMSQLLFEKEKPILSGFTRIVNAFKADGLMHIQRNEAAISIIADYIYKALLDDQGINTFIYIQQIHSSLIKFIGLLNEDSSLFSTELKSRIKLLSNYATPYDHFSRADGAFKVFCQYFLRLFKYDNYEIEINNKAKLTDFRKKQYQKLMNPFTFQNLSQNFGLKNFNDVSSNQPLVQIDVCLKIFLILCDYNKNIWTTFYENKLVSGFSSLLNKISNLVLFYLNHSANRWTSYANSKSYLLTLDNYLTVVKHVLMLMAKKCRYESAYNDLLEEDIFEDVELYQKSIQIYIHLYNALHDDCMMIYTTKSKNKIKYILTLIIEILDQFLIAYELIPHQTRELKLKKLLEHLYITHYSSLKPRGAILSIYSQIIKHSQGSTCKYFLQYLLDSHFTINKLLQNEVAYVPQNDRSMIENIIKSNLYRAHPVINNNLAALIKNLFNKAQFTDKTNDIIDRLFEQIDQQYKKNEEQAGQIGWSNLRKTHLFTQMLKRIDITFKSRLDDKLIRFFKRILDNFRKRVDSRQLNENVSQQNFIIFLQIKQNFLTYFSRLLREQQNSTLFNQLFEALGKMLTLQYFTFDNILNQSQFVRKVNLEVLKSCCVYLQGLANLGLSAYYQCHLLYGEVMEKPYKIQTFISFSEIMTILEKIVSSKVYQEGSEQLRQIKKITSSIFYFLCTLTTINEEDLFTTQSRRGAIIYLLTPHQKQLPFQALKQSPLYKFIPRQFIKLLQEYFSYPIVEKPITIKPKLEVKPPTKTKAAIYSKSVFSIISEHDPVSKTRFKFIGGEWIGGDINKGLYTPFRNRNYDQEIQKYFKIEDNNAYEGFHLREYSFVRQNIVFNELFYLSLRKDRQQVQKKEIERTIQLKDVIPRVTPQQIKKDIPKLSPSPSKPMTSANITSHLSPPPNTYIPSTSPPLAKQSSLGSSKDGSFNRGSNPRSNSQTSSQPYGTNPSGYYNPRQVGVPPPHYNPNMPPPGPMHGYPPASYPPNSYPPQYTYPPNTYPPNPHQRYPPNYHPMNPGMYNPSMSKPMPNMYNPGMYAQNHLNKFEEQMFHEAYALVNQIKSGNSSESQINAKKSKLNYILSTHPKVHTKLKDSLMPQQN